MNLLLTKKLYNFQEQDRNNITAEINFENAVACNIEYIYVLSLCSEEKGHVYIHILKSVLYIVMDIVYVE